MIDRILHNGKIITLDPQQPRVTALAIHRGEIVAVGDDAQILALAGRGTIRENLNERVLIPGLTDAHIHWEWTSKGLQSVNLFEVPSKEEALRRVAERAANTPAGEWITGWGWTQEAWEDRSFPTAADLDRAAPHHPVYLSAKSGHAGWANSLALRLSGIDRSTAHPEGGQIVHDEQGEPSGLLLETAMGLVAKCIPPLSPERLAEAMLQAQELALRSGLTGIHDFDNPSCLVALQILRERGQLGLRVVKQINRDWLEPAIASGLRSGFGDEWLRIGALKLFADGALGPRTAYMVDPYEGEPENRGISVLDKEEMLELVSRASQHGLASTIHAIGDRAMRDVLDVFEQVRRDETKQGITPGQRRHRIEHVQIIHPDDRNRLAELKIIASMQPIHATSDYEMATRYWGARSYWAYNARYQADQGVVLAFGSDSPVEPFEPLKGIYAAVTRQRADGTPGGGWYPELRLTVDEALRGFTQGPAYAAGLEHRLGRLMPGYCADAVLLDRDLYAIEPETILETQVLGTIVGGEWRFGGA